MQGVANATDSLLAKAVDYFFNPLYQIAVVVAFLYFLYGVTRLLFQMNSPDKRGEARAHLLYGIIGLFIILSVGAIFKFLNDLVGGGLIY